MPCGVSLRKGVLSGWRRQRHDTVHGEKSVADEYDRSHRWEMFQKEGVFTPQLTEAE